MIRKILVFALLCLLSAGCGRDSADVAQIKRGIARYNQLLVEGYKGLNMNYLQEVATPELATKAYYHMSAIGEGKLRMESALKELTFNRIELRRKDEAIVETREVWDFRYVEMKTGKTYYEEKDFVYEMGYTLKKHAEKWTITHITTISGKTGTTTVPWPEIKRNKDMTPLK
ncbi:hypothetical protein GeomeDRAFT_0891 [Geobacter metallireducens RCH3]|uniref:Lipoprotein, putative n=1 Tax=Geobacter metallireducens (strain ATCC 53774 / DSM 7210 / GS-15) TaxID=269799 RepID=Q39Y57_GEOMG|nr:lipoprotein, putative [Geobacter metallireducens GS-15]EHP88229.1 hypothetical protein GeomeDRAFT_0891 [Geobacter metallireducens RCH3]